MKNDRSGHYPFKEGGCATDQVKSFIHDLNPSFITYVESLLIPCGHGSAGFVERVALGTFTCFGFLRADSTDDQVVVVDTEGPCLVHATHAKTQPGWLSTRKSLLRYEHLGKQGGGKTVSLAVYVV